MKHTLDVVKVMTPFPHTIDCARSIGDAEEMLNSFDRYLLPVTSGDTPVAIITLRDLAVAKAVAPQQSGKEFLIKDLNLPAAYTVEATEQLGTAVSHMLREGIQGAIVVKKGRVVGTFTFADAYSLLLKFLTGSFSLYTPPDISA